MILSHPFRVEPFGAIAVVEEGSTRANAEAVAVLAGTLRGERLVEPDFGVTDPTFNQLDPVEVQTGLAQFGPDGITIKGVQTRVINDMAVRVTLSFDETELL